MKTLRYAAFAAALCFASAAFAQTKSLITDPTNTSQQAHVDQAQDLHVACDVGCGSGSGGSQGTNGQTAPTASTQIGSQDGSGNLQAASTAHPVPVQIAPAAAGANGTFSKNATVSASGATQLVAASGSTVVSVTGWSCNNSGSTTVYATLEDGSGGSQIGPLIECPAGGANNMAPGASWAVTTAGNGLYFTISGSTTSVSMAVVGTQR